MIERLRKPNVEIEPTHKKYVVLIGPSLSGKSTVVRSLREQGYTSLPEPNNDTLLRLMHNDPKKYAFRNQLNITNELMKLETVSETSRVHSDPHFAESGVLSTQIYNRYLRDKGFINDDEFRMLDELYQYHMQRLPNPDLVVFLDAPIPVLAERALSYFGTIAFDPEELQHYWKDMLHELRAQGIAVQEINTSKYSVPETIALILEEVKKR